MKQYCKTEPFACDLSRLPKYSPSKEIDIKMRDKARKQASQIRRTDEPQAESKEHTVYICFENGKTLGCGSTQDIKENIDSSGGIYTEQITIVV